MSYELVQEVRDHAPLDLSATERLILVWIAEQSREEDRYYRGEQIEARTCWPGRENLMRWAGIASERTFRAALQKLADRGLDVRVPLGTDKLGNVLYAVKGQRMVLRLPELRWHFSAGTGQPYADKEAAECTEGGISQPPTHENPSTRKEPTLITADEVPRFDVRPSTVPDPWHTYSGQVDLPDREDLWETGS